MGETPAAGAKLLFVVSADFGELAYALHFVQGGPFRPVLLLPERLAAVQGGRVPVRPYRDLAGVLRAVEGERPDAVFLCCGYLLAVNGLLPEPDVVALVGGLRQRGCRVVTTDPFLGLWSAGAPVLSERHPLHGLFTDHFRRLGRLFRDVVHLHAVRPPEGTPVPWVSYSNPRLLLGPADWAGLPAAVRELGADPERPRWLFVLSQEDYGAGAGALGRARFEDQMADHVRATTREGRQAVVVAPSECLRAVAGRLGAGAGGALLLPTCPYPAFRALLLEAEHVFFRNLFSHSVPLRGMNRRSLFFFDGGHMAHAFPSLLPVALRCYYGGATVPYLDPAAPLRAEALAAAAARQDAELAPARAVYFSSPAPEEVVAGLLRGG